MDRISEKQSFDMRNIQVAGWPAIFDYEQQNQMMMKSLKQFQQTQDLLLS